MADQDPFAGTLPSSNSGSDYDPFVGTISNAPRPKPENILQKAASSIKPALSGMMSSGPDIFGGPGMQFGNEFKKQMMGITPFQGDHPIADYAKDYFTNPETYSGAMLGAEAINPLIEASQNGMKNIGQIVSDIFHSGGNLKNVNTELEGLNQSIPAERAGTQRGINVLDTANKNMTGDIQTSGDQSLQNLNSEFKNKQQGLKTQLGDQSREAAQNAKEPISQTSIENSKTFSSKLDSIESNMKTPITKSEYYHNVIEPSLKQIASSELPGGPAQSRIVQLAKEYDPANSVSMNIEGPQETKISLNKIKNDKNSVYNAMSEGSQQGNQQHGAHEVANDIFQRNHAKFLESRVPEWHAMNQEYAPQIEAQRFGHKSFQPGETDTNKGMNVIQKAAMNPKSDEATNIGQLEKGTQNFKGTGDLMGKTKDTATALKTLKNEYLGNKDAMVKDISDRINNLNQSFAEDAAGIKRTGEEKVGNMLQKQSQLQQRQAELKHLVVTRNWLIGAGVGLTGGVGEKIYKAYKVLNPH